MGESRTNAITMKSAFIKVTTKPGATVTFVKGGTTYSTKTADGSGIAQIEVRFSDWGTFTINGSWSATGISNPATGSGSVTISSATTYNVTVALKWYLIQSGDFTGFSHTVHGSDHPDFRDEGSYVWLSNDVWGNPSLDGYTSGYFTNGIAVADWKTMVIDFEGRGESDHMGLVTETTADAASFTNSVRIVYQKGEGYTTRATQSLDITSATGTKYVALRVHANYSPGYSNWPGDLRIYNLYLQS